MTSPSFRSDGLQGSGRLEKAGFRAASLSLKCRPPFGAIMKYLAAVEVESLVGLGKAQRSGVHGVLECSHFTRDSDDAVQERPINTNK